MRLSLSEAKALVKKEMFKYLDKNIWQLEFMKSYAYFGICLWNCNKKTKQVDHGLIKINLLLMEQGYKHEILSVIRHEIAHAIINSREKAQHGKLFKAACSVLGTSDDKAYVDGISLKFDSMDQIRQYQLEDTLWSSYYERLWLDQWTNEDRTKLLPVTEKIAALKSKHNKNSKKGV